MDTRFLKYKKRISSVAFSPDGRLMAVGTQGQVKYRQMKHHRRGMSFVEGVIHLWDLKSGEKLRTLVRHKRSVNSIHFTPDGKKLLSAGGGERYLWLVSSDTPELDIKGKDFRGQISLSSNGQIMASGGKRGTVYIFDLKEGDLKKRMLSSFDKGSKYENKHQYIDLTLFLRDNNTLISKINGKTPFHLWNINRGTFRAVGKPQYGYKATVTKDGRILAHGSGNNVQLMTPFAGQSGFVLGALEGKSAYMLFHSTGEKKIKLSRKEKVNYHRYCGTVALQNQRMHTTSHLSYQNDDRILKVGQGGLYGQRYQFWDAHRGILKSRCKDLSYAEASCDRMKPTLKVKTGTFIDKLEEERREREIQRCQKIGSPILVRIDCSHG
ncbi:WD40 repeat domain-containing protein [Magnetococcales bacterium HHB-1]